MLSFFNQVQPTHSGQILYILPPNLLTTSLPQPFTILLFIKNSTTRLPTTTFYTPLAAYVILTSSMPLPKNLLQGIHLAFSWDIQTPQKDANASIQCITILYYQEMWCFRSQSYLIKHLLSIPIFPLCTKPLTLQDHPLYQSQQTMPKKWTSQPLKTSLTPHSSIIYTSSRHSPSPINELLLSTTK